MFEVRSEQIGVLDRCHADRFTERAFVFVVTRFPEGTADLGGRETRLAVKDGIAHAEAHGIISEEGILHSLSVRFPLGPEFDRDPEYPWAGEIRPDRRIADPEDGALLLLGTTREHADAAAAREGPHGR